MASAVLVMTGYYIELNTIVCFPWPPSEFFWLLLSMRSEMDSLAICCWHYNTPTALDENKACLLSLVFTHMPPDALSIRTSHLIGTKEACVTLHLFFTPVPCQHIIFKRVSHSFRRPIAPHLEIAVLTGYRQTGSVVPCKSIGMLLRDLAHISLSTYDLSERSGQVSQEREPYARLKSTSTASQFNCPKFDEEISYFFNANGVQVDIIIIVHQPDI